MPVAQPSQPIQQFVRWQQGRKVAQDAARLLLENFGVKQVVLFGSLLDPAKVRQLSDVDLAVWGLADHDYYRALSALTTLSPCFTFDLVQIESASPGLREVIEQQGQVIHPSEVEIQVSTGSTVWINQDREMVNYRVLFGQIERELEELTILTHKVEALLGKLRQTQDDDYLGTVALDIHSFYSGIERIFKQIAQTVDRSIPDSADWHRQLLRQMAAPVWDIRPPVLRPETLAMLEDYCSFRHVVRNIYSMNLKFDRVEALASGLPECLTLVRDDLQHFIQAICNP
jgi:predicted nucleotidyltransferase